MIEIKDLLLRFSNILLGEEVKKEFIKEALYQTVNLKVKSEDIKIKNGTVYLNIKPIYKNELLLRKDKITAFLEKNLGRKAPHEIR